MFASRRTLSRISSLAFGFERLERLKHHGPIHLSSLQETVHRAGGHGGGAGALSALPASGRSAGDRRVALVSVRDKKKYGPYTWQQLLALSRRGEVRPADMLLQEGARQWLRAEPCPGLFATPPLRPNSPNPADAAPAALAGKKNATPTIKKRRSAPG